MSQIPPVHGMDVSATPRPGSFAPADRGEWYLEEDLPSGVTDGGGPDLDLGGTATSSRGELMSENPNEKVELDQNDEPANLVSPDQGEPEVGAADGDEQADAKDDEQGDEQADDDVQPR